MSGVLFCENCGHVEFDDDDSFEGPCPECGGMTFSDVTFDGENECEEFERD